MEHRPERLIEPRPPLDRVGEAWMALLMAACAAATVAACWAAMGPPGNG